MRPVIGDSRVLPTGSHPHDPAIPSPKNNAPNRPQRRLALLIFAALSVAIAACTPQDMGELSGKARFSEYPDSLISALEFACTGPAQTFVRSNRESVECREYLPPEATAAIILSYDGTPTDLPQLVIRFQTAPDGQDYVVRNDVYLNVPQKSGPPLHVRQHDARMSRLIADLYRRAGGLPEA